MCSSQQPLTGADAYNPRPWVVVMEEDDQGRYDVRVPLATGRRDAMNQAKLDHPYDSPVDAKELA